VIILDRKYDYLFPLQTKPVCLLVKCIVIENTNKSEFISETDCGKHHYLNEKS